MGCRGAREVSRRRVRCSPLSKRVGARSACRAHAGGRRCARSRGRSAGWCRSAIASAQAAAINMAMPARMSGLSTRCPRRRAGPFTIARCGSHRVMSAPMSTSLSVKTSRFSNIHSWMSTEPEHCVASATAIDVSRRERGQGPSCTFILCSPTSRLAMSCCSPGTTRSSPSATLCSPDARTRGGSCADRRGRRARCAALRR